MAEIDVPPLFEKNVRVGFLDTRDHTTEKDPASELCLNDAGEVFFTTYPNEKLHCINTDGETKWIYEPETPFTSAPSLSVNNEILIGDSSGKLLFIGSDGKLKQTFDLGTNARYPAVSALDGTIFVGANQIFSLTPEGELNWKSEI